MNNFSYFQSQTSNKQIASSIEELRSTIVYHSKKYYDHNDPEISDTEFDQLFLLLKKWEEQFPNFITKDSPTQKIVYAVSEKLEKVPHLVPMISLGNVFNREELEKWEERWKKLVGDDQSKTNTKEVLYIVEPKFDGLGISCIWEHGVFDRAVTRGDGEEGENVTENVKTISEIPRAIPLKNNDNIFELRGEIVMKKSEFERLNTQLQKEEKKQFSNPRNAAAGSLRQLDANITAKRKLSVFFYETPVLKNNTQSVLKNYSESLSFLEQNIIPHPPVYYACNTIQEVEDAIQKIYESRNTLDYDIDGAVVKINNYNLREQIGSTGHHPRWATAWKFPATQVTTQVEHVEWQVGRTGVLTPVAHLFPVNIDGVMVSRATLHNFDNIIQKDIRLGDTVFLERSGDVIPKITSVITAKRTGDEHVIVQPAECPICSHSVIEIPDEVALRCVNPACPHILKGQLIHFASKKCMNIVGLGNRVAEEIIDKKIIENISDIYTLTFQDLEKIEGFKDKSITNLLAAIEKSTSQPFWRVINALGIPLIGEKTAKILANKYLNFTKLSAVSTEEFADIYDIGEKTGEEIVKFFSNNQNKKIVEKLTRYLKYSQYNTINQNYSSVLEGKNFVITGKFISFSRDELSEKIEQCGGKVLSALSKKTDYLVAGEKPGSKRNKAQDLNISILGEEEFLYLIGADTKKNISTMENDTDTPLSLF